MVDSIPLFQLAPILQPQGAALLGLHAVSSGVVAETGLNKFECLHRQNNKRHCQQQGHHHAALSSCALATAAIGLRGCSSSPCMQQPRLRKPNIPACCPARTAPCVSSLARFSTALVLLLPPQLVEARCRARGRRRRRLQDLPAVAAAAAALAPADPLALAPASASACLPAACARWWCLACPPAPASCAGAAHAAHHCTARAASAGARPSAGDFPR